MPPRRSLATALFVSLSLVVSGEFALRAASFSYPGSGHALVFWDRERDPDLRAGKGLFVLDAHQLWKPRPGALIPWTTGERINRFGLRGPEIELVKDKHSGVVRIAALGGGAVFGVGVRWEDTWCAQLVRDLERRGIRSEILCAGVPEHTIRQGLERWRDIVKPFRPDLVISTFTGHRECMPAIGSLTDDEKIARLADIGFEATQPALHERARTTQLFHWLADVATGEYWQERVAEFDDRRNSKDYGKMEWPRVRRVPTDDFEHSSNEIHDDLRRDGGRLMILNIPRAPSSADGVAIDVYMDAMYAWARRHDVPVLDARHAFLASTREDEISKEELFHDEQYPSECGHAAVAEALGIEIESWIARIRAGDRR